MGDLGLEGLSSLSKTSDHIGALANVLKDLGGTTTLLHELIQNADDSLTATSVRFTLDENALTVWNDGVFTSCGEQDQDLCPWKHGGKRSCDLHSFRRFAGRHKAADTATTGAFGVGFTCVYQVTDHPELITGGEHLVLDELASEGDRINVCSGSCERDHSTPGTTFVLPWARTLTKLRRELGVQPCTDADIQRIGGALHAHAAESLIFLHRVETLEIHTPKATRRIKRTTDEERIFVLDGQQRQEWLLLEGSGTSPDDLKTKFRNQIDPDRSSLVQVALRIDEPADGHIYAGLPTQTPSGWNGHINATFYPRQDRKGVQFDDETFRSEWNRYAIDTAAVIIAEQLQLIAETIGFTDVWRLLRDFERIDRDVDAGIYDESFRAFLDRSKEMALDAPILLTSDARCVKPVGCLVPQSAGEYASTHVLADLGLAVVNESLRSLVMETSYTDYGIHQLTASNVVEAIRDNGVVAPWRASEGPFDSGQMESLLVTLELLVTRSIGNLAATGLREIAVVPCLDNMFAPLSEVVLTGDSDETDLLRLLAPDLLIVDAEAVERLCPSLISRCNGMTVGYAIELLEAADPTSLDASADLLLDWFDDRRSQIHDTEIQARLAKLPIFPSASGELRPLSALSLQSDFIDHLGVASLVDPERTQGHSDLLRLLGAQELGAVEYLVKHVVPMATDGQLSDDDLLHVLEIVSQSRAQLEIDQFAFEVLADTPLVPCRDDVVRPARAVHMPTSAIELIAPAEPLADTAAMPPHIRDALVWLGVSSLPSQATLNAAASRLSTSADDPDVDVVTAILGQLAATADEHDSVPKSLANLQELPWLPVEGGGREKPNAVYPTFARYLFESQGPKLDLSRPLQEFHRQTLYWLGMPSAPTTQIVVAHLLHCAEHSLTLHNEVYTALGDAEEHGFVQKLRDERCIQVSPGVFVEPASTFWSTTGFGRWAHRLSHEHRRYQNFFDLVGVKDQPGPAEIAAILRRVSREIGNDPLDDDEQDVVHECWSQLSEMVIDQPDETPAVLTQLSNVRCAIDSRMMLIAPAMLLFRDARGLSDHMDLLSHNVVRRERSTWRALTAAGVESADDHISIELQDVETSPALDLQSKLSDRRDAIVRVLEGIAGDEEDPFSEAPLFELELFTASELHVRFRASIGHAVQVTDPRRMDAVYLDHDNERRLVFEVGAPIRSIARELARCLAPAGDLSRIAPLLDAVLSEASLADAHQALSDFGVADLTHLKHHIVESAEAEDVKGFDTMDDESPADVEGDAELGAIAVDQATELDHSKVNSPNAAAANTDDESGQTSFEPDHDVVDDSVYGDERAVSEGSASEQPAGTRRSAGRKSSAQQGRKHAPQSRLRSYVVFGDEGSTGTVGDEAPAGSSIDAAGISRVLDFEESCGRHPEEQDHSNPGFDILSRNAEGKVVRRIEVKSTGSDWTIRGVMMSSRQYQEATANTSDFWLYVVENAEDREAFNIYRIHNPVEQIAYYGFDEGWKGVAEPDIDRDESGKPVALSSRSLLRWNPSAH